MKEAVLKALRQKDHISGEELARQLHVSRTAVWKCVGQLRKRGYSIQSAPGLGYILAASPDLLLPEEINAGLATKYIGRRIEHFEEIGSTQERARQLAAEQAEEGTAVVAERQTGGRGRLGRSWASPPHTGIYVSIILRPNLKPTDVRQIPLITGVATSRAIERVTGTKPRIKWPNDILIDGKKVAGILAEMGAEVDRLHYIALGIGINVNTKTAMLPKEVQGTATSLAEQCGKKVSRVRLLQALFEELEFVYEEFKEFGFRPGREHWKALDGTIGSRVRVSMGERELEGEALDLDPDGALVVKRDDGGLERVIAGDVYLRIHQRG